MIRKVIKKLVTVKYGQDNVYVFERDHTDPYEEGLREFNIKEMDELGRRDTFMFKYGWWYRPYDRYIKVDFGRNGEESDIRLNICLLGLHWFSGVSSSKTKKFRVSQDKKSRYEPLTTGFSLGYAGSIFAWDFDMPKNSWKSKALKKQEGISLWRQGSFCARHILGRDKIDTTKFFGGETKVTLPEGDYPATWETNSYKRYYVRWPGKALNPFIKQPSESISVDVEGGVPVWGKGENSWDCGLDAHFGSTSPAYLSVADATREFANGVIQAREQYGDVEIPRPMSLVEAQAYIKETNNG